jgi:hypothetical protein
MANVPLPLFVFVAPFAAAATLGRSCGPTQCS